MPNNYTPTLIDDPRIFTGTVAEFCDRAIVQSNNGSAERTQTPLPTCPTIRKNVCVVCNDYDFNLNDCVAEIMS